MMRRKFSTVCGEGSGLILISDWILHVTDHDDADDALCAQCLE